MALMLRLLILTYDIIWLMKGDNDYLCSKHEYIYIDPETSLPWLKYFEFMGTLKFVYSIVNLELQFCFISDILYIMYLLGALYYIS